MSYQISKVITTADKRYKLWVSEKKGKFTTIEGEKGHFSPNVYYGAKANRKGGDVEVPDPAGEGLINVDEEDAAKMGRLANKDEDDKEWDDEHIIPSLGESYTGKEIAQAYIDAGQEQGSVVRYIGD